MNLSEMLDLPKDQRRPYLRALPLTFCYVADCWGDGAVKHMRRIITRNGGVYRECYRYPGVYWDMTFRTHAGMLQAARDICLWMNKILDEHNDTGLPVENYYHSTQVLEHKGIPALSFEIDVDLPHKREVRRPAHPIRG